MVESHNIEHQRTSAYELVLEHQNENYTGITHRYNSVQGVNRLEMSLDGKYYDNLKFTSIAKNKDREWSHDYIKIDTNFMLTQMSAKKGDKLFKEIKVEAIIKSYIQLDNMNVAGPEKPDVLTPQKTETHL